MTEVISEEIPSAANRIAALSGPNISFEMAQGKPTAAVVAASSEELAVRIRDMVKHPFFASTPQST